MSETTEREFAIRQIMKEYAVTRLTAEEMLPREIIKKRAAHEKWKAARPAREKAAREAYNAEIAKGGKNAQRRAVLAARQIKPDFMS